MAIGVRESFACFRRPEEVLLDNAGIITEHDAFGGDSTIGMAPSRRSPKIRFRPKVCWPYRAKTKGRSSSSVQWLSDESFVIPLAATLKSAGLMLDVHTACTRPTPILRAARGGRARARHGTTAKRRAHRLGEERNALLALPVATASTPRPITPKRQVMPRESLQHPQRL